MNEEKTKQYCSICGEELKNPKFTRNYPNFVCWECDKRAVNSQVNRAKQNSTYINSEQPVSEMLIDEGDNPIFIVRNKFFGRYYPFGSYITIINIMECNHIFVC